MNVVMDKVSPDNIPGAYGGLDKEAVLKTFGIIALIAILIFIIIILIYIIIENKLNQSKKKEEKSSTFCQSCGKKTNGYQLCKDCFDKLQHDDVCKCKNCNGYYYKGTICSCMKKT